MSRNRDPTFQPAPFFFIAVAVSTSIFRRVFSFPPTTFRRARPCVWIASLFSSHFFPFFFATVSRRRVANSSFRHSVSVERRESAVCRSRARCSCHHTDASDGLGFSLARRKKSETKNRDGRFPFFPSSRRVSSSPKLSATAAMRKRKAVSVVCDIISRVAQMRFCCSGELARLSDSAEIILRLLRFALCRSIYNRIIRS